MKKLIKPSDWLLLTLAGLLDFIQDIKDPFNLFKNYYQDVYGIIPSRWQKVNFSHLIWRNVKIGNINKKVVKGKIYLEITSQGEKKIREKYPLLDLVNQVWDGKIRFVIYDIEEENKRIRELFRKKVKELGFGMLQKSVWISPYDFLVEFREFLETHQLNEKVILIETKNFYSGDLKKLAEKVWSLEKINNLYKDLYKDLLRFKSLKKPSDRNKKLKSLKKKIISVYFQDPFLPEEFLPNQWLGEEVRRLVKKLKIFQ